MAAKVLITDHPWPDLNIERAILEPAGLELVDAPNEEEATLVSLAGDVFAIATCWAQVTPAVVQAATECQLICRMGIGLDNIAIPEASARGIPVTNVPDYCVEEVADHTLGLLLAVTRNIAFFHHRTKRGEYNLAAGPPMNRLRGRRLGLIGFGRIGREVWQRAQSFGLDVVASTPSMNAYGTTCPMVPLAELLATSDIISLHAPLSESTRHLINREMLSQLKSGVLLINTSRGPLIDPAALQVGLESGRIAGAGLDVFEPEPPILSLPMYCSERVIVTPHAAFVSEEALVDLRTRVAQQIRSRWTGGTPENIVNAQNLT